MGQGTVAPSAMGQGTVAPSAMGQGTVAHAPSATGPHATGTSTTVPAPIPDSVVKWLFGVIQPIYTSDPRATFHDTMVALTHWRCLRPRTRVHTNATGSSQLLLCLWGELGGVPLQLWVPTTYPREPPSVYVDMEALPSGRRLQPSDAVAGDGQVHWQQGPWDAERCNIAQVVARVGELAPGLLAEPRTDTSPLASASPSAAPPLPPKPETMAPHPVQERPTPTHGGPTPIYDRPTPTHTGPSPGHQGIPPPDLLSLDSTPDATHTTLLAQLQSTLSSLAAQDASRLAAEDQAHTQRYTDVAAQFRANLAHQQASVARTADEAKEQRDQLTAALASLHKFETDRLGGGNTQGPALDTVVGTGNDTLYELLALDAALSDAVQLCSRMLDGGVLPVETFVRQTRLLATRQFQVRDALARVASPA